MNDYILFMHTDALDHATPEAWPSYFEKLQKIGAFQGGSSIGGGEVLRKVGTAGQPTHHLSGYIRIQAESFAAAKALLDGNPVYECGGSVEIRELPRD